MNVAGPRTTTATEIKAGLTNKRQRFGGDLTSEVCVFWGDIWNEIQIPADRDHLNKSDYSSPHIKKKTTKSTQHDTHHQSAVARLDR